MVVRVIDIETTGVDPHVDRIVEIASGDMAGRDDLGQKRGHLCHPGIPIPPRASAIHHIIDSDVADQPPIERVIGLYEGADIYVAHNAAFEESFLAQHLGTVQWFCTLKAALRIWPDAPGHSNQVLRYHLGLIDPLGFPREKLVAHRALSDVIVTAAIFSAMCNAAKWQDMLAWQKEPPLYTRFSFGKHKGERLSEVPADYLTWIVAKSDLDDGWKFSAQHWLQATTRGK